MTDTLTPLSTSLSDRTDGSQQTGETIVSVRNVSKKFSRNLRRSMVYGLADLGRNLIGKPRDADELRPDEFWALRDVSFELRRGEALGLMGVNGSGKTTLLRLLAGIFPPDQGEISVRGRVGALIALGAGFHPHMTGRENIYLNASILGIERREIEAKFDEIVDFSEIRDFLEAPVASYSSGMKVRLGFAIATALEVDLLLIDEVLAVGDIAFRIKCYQRLNTLLKDTAVIFVSHNITDVGRVCNRTIVLNRGEIVFSGDSLAGINYYLDQFEDDTSEAVFTVFDTDLTIRTSRLVPEEATTGDVIIFLMRYHSERDIEIDSLRCNLKNTADVLVADYASEYLNTRFYLSKGEHELEVYLGQTVLTTGQYTFNIMASDAATGKNLFHGANVASIKITGKIPTTAITELG